MQVSSHKRRFRSILVARLVIAATLAFALLSGIVPLGFTSGHLCKMACCASMAPHMAASCAHGSCHIDLSVRKPTPPQLPAPPKRQEEHCEKHSEQTLQQRVEHKQGEAAPQDEDSSQADHSHELIVGFATPESSTEQTNSQSPARAAASAFTKPCPPDCGAGSFSSSTQNRKRESAALAYAVRPRPPSSAGSASADYHLSKKLRLICRRCVPRGPPASFS